MKIWADVNNSPSCFFLCLVNVFPEVFVATPNRSAGFRCFRNLGTFTGVQWLLNNTPLEDLNITDVTAVFDSTFGGRLTFSNPFGYNGTFVTCRAELQSGPAENTALLLVQGTFFLLIIMICLFLPSF